MPFYSFFRVGLLTFLSISAASAKDLTIPEANCHITIPEAWSPITMATRSGAYLIGARDAEQTQGTSLYVASLAHTVDEQATYIKQMEHGLTAGHTHTILSRQHKQIGNFDFYVVEGTQPARGGGTMHCSEWITFVDEQVFQIDLYSQNTDPLTDSSLLAVIESFTIAPPK